MKRYIIAGVLISIAVPFFSLLIPILNLIVDYLFVFPLVIVAWIFGHTDVWLDQQMFGILPVGIGWFINIVSIVIIGALSGYLVYILRRAIYRRKGIEIPRVGFSGLIVIVAFQIFILIALILTFGAKISADQKLKWAQEKQSYVEKNCQKIDEGGRHYYSCTNPNQLIFDTSFESILK